MSFSLPSRDVIADSIETGSITFFSGFWYYIDLFRREGENK
jgi:hypothetical protein